MLMSAADANGSEDLLVADRGSSPDSQSGAKSRYGNVVCYMKTTIDLPDELLIAAKKRAAETRTTLREIFERGLRRELQTPQSGRAGRRSGRAIRWVTARGGLPPGLDIADREKMHEWLRKRP